MLLPQKYCHVALVLPLLLLAQATVAQETAPLPPPNLCVDNIDCLTLAEDVPYDLGPVPFSYSWPNEPDITSEVTVTPATIGSNGNLTTNGRRLILTAGNYGALTVSGNDRELVFQSGVTTGTISIAGVRMVFRGVPERAHQINNFQTSPWNIGAANRTDLLFVGLNIVSGEGNQDSHRNLIMAHRVAFVRCYIDSVGFGLHMSLGGGNEDIIIAGTFINARRAASDSVGGNTTQAALRIDSFQRFISIDSRYRNDNESGGSSRQHLRLHANTSGPSRHVYVRNNEFIGTALQFRPRVETAAHPFTNSWFEDNDFYPYLIPRLTPNIIGAGTEQDPQPTNVVWSGNRIYTDSGNAFSIGSTTWQHSDNQVLPSREPPAFTY